MYKLIVQLNSHSYNHNDVTNVFKLIIGCDVRFCSWVDVVRYYIENPCIAMQT